MMINVVQLNSNQESSFLPPKEISKGNHQEVASSEMALLKDIALVGDCCDLPEEETHQDAPPLDTVTITTSSESCSSCCCDDDTNDDNHGDEDSTCSSISCDIHQAAAPPRSIFASYWKSEGFEAAPFRRCVPAPAMPFSIKGQQQQDDYQYHDHSSAGSSLTRNNSIIIKRTKDQDILLQEVAATASPQGLKRTQARRSIFGMDAVEQPPNEPPAAQPEPSASSPLRNRRVASGPLQELLAAADQKLFRKTKSAPTLQRKSALRSGRFSNSGNHQRSNIRRSVSFDEQVHVAVFTNPTTSVLVEQWAPQGWSTWFA